MKNKLLKTSILLILLFAFNEFCVAQFYTVRKGSELEDGLYINEPQPDSEIMFYFPLKSIHLTSHFGMRKHPIKNIYLMHNGVDLKADYEEVFAITEGVIEKAGYDERSGNYIVIRHTDN